MLRDGGPPVLCMRKSLSFVNSTSQIDGTVLEPGLIEHGLGSSLSSLGPPDHCLPNTTQSCVPPTALTSTDKPGAVLTKSLLLKDVL